MLGQVFAQSPRRGSTKVTLLDGRELDVDFCLGTIAGVPLRRVLNGLAK